MAMNCKESQCKLEKHIYPAATHFKYESSNPVYIVTVAKKYTIFMKFVPLHVTYIIQIQNIFSISILRIIRHRKGWDLRSQKN